MGTNIRYISYSNQIILTLADTYPKQLIYRGIVVDIDTREAVSFATLQLKNQQEYVIAGSKGEFEIDIEKNISNDTLVVYAFSYRKLEFPISELSPASPSVIYLQKKDFCLDTIAVKPKAYSINELGNGGVFSSGSMYIDTHGQQTALFIENSNKQSGKILKLKYKLSDKGNVYAPFRVRIYAPDNENKPGKDILEDIVIVKPENSHPWFEIDISAYNISVPESGFFVGMEGVYPNNYESFYSEAQFENISELTQNITEYGQRISFNKKNKNNTWHYSLSHTWFKTDKKRFNVMIKAEVKFYEN